MAKYLKPLVTHIEIEEATLNMNLLMSSVCIYTTPASRLHIAAVWFNVGIIHLYLTYVYGSVLCVCVRYIYTLTKA